MIQDIDEVVVTSNIASLLDELDREIAAFRALGEFPTEVQEEIQREFLPNRISDTLNIEGIRVNPRVTRAILEGLTIAESDQYNEREILNVIAANELVEAEGRRGAALTVQLLKELHRRVEEGLIASAGSFRQKDVKITGAIEQPPSWADIPDLIAELCERYARMSDVHPLIKAAWLHASFTRIHPFEDGNGRTGRLLQDFSLISEGLLPVGVPAARRQQYYDALEGADGGEWQPLLHMIADAELTALDRARRIAEAPLKRRAGVQALLRAASNKTKQRDYNVYEIWRRKVEGLRDEFVRWAEDVNADADGLRIRMHSYEPVSFEKWKEVREAGYASGTWLLTLRFLANRTPLYSFLFYVRRHDHHLVDSDREISDGMVGVFLTGAQEPNAKYEFVPYRDPYVSLREMLFDGSELITFSSSSNTEASLQLPDEVDAQFTSDRWRNDGDLLLPDVVQTFYTEALGKLGLI